MLKIYLSQAAFGMIFEDKRRLSLLYVSCAKLHELKFGNILPPFSIQRHRLSRASCLCPLFLFQFLPSGLVGCHRGKDCKPFYFFFSGTNHRGRGDAERIRHNREQPGQAGEAVPAPDLRHHPLAAEQQVGQGAPAGRRPHLQDCRRHEDLPGGEAHGPSGGELDYIVPKSCLSFEKKTPNFFG